MAQARTAVIDGADGYVASNMICEMTKRGIRVKALARAGRARVLDAVLSAPVNEARHVTPQCLAEVETFDFELTEENLGIPDAVARSIFSERCDFWHTAAAVDLSPNRAALLFKVNVIGTERALRIFVKYAQEGSRFFFISSAYAGGISNDPIAETWFPMTDDAQFRTVYEATKRQGELVFRDFMLTHGVEGAVFRLGQVVGSSRTGHTTSNFGIYDFMSGMKRVARRFPGGVVAVQVADGATLNLVPVDVCVEWLLALAGALVLPKPPIVNLTDRQGVSAAEAVRLVGEGLGMTLHPVRPEEWDDRQRTRLDRAVGIRLAYSGKYLTECIEFDRRNLESTIQVPDQVCDLELVARLVERYLSANA